MSLHDRRRRSSMTTMNLVLATPEADLAYDVHGPLPTADGRPPLVMIGQPMDASGFTTLASLLPERTVITYDPRGLGRSVRKDGRRENVPGLQATDVHAIIEALGAGPVEMFASSGGAVTSLALVAAYPDDVTTLVAHEPPLIRVLPDGLAAERAWAGVREAYEAAAATPGWPPSSPSRRGRASSATPTLPSQRRIRRCSACRPRTTAPGRPAAVGRVPGGRRLPAGCSGTPAAPTRIVIAVGEESRDSSPDARRWRSRNCWASSRPCSLATTVGSWAATAATRASPKPSQSGSARCSAADAVGDVRAHRRDFDRRLRQPVTSDSCKQRRTSPEQLRGDVQPEFVEQPCSPSRKQEPTSEPPPMTNTSRSPAQPRTSQQLRQARRSRR